MLPHRDRTPDFSDTLQIDFGQAESRAFATFREYGAPGVDDQAVPIGMSETARIMGSFLGGCHKVALTFDGASAQQRVPVVFAGLKGEGRGNHQDLCTFFDQFLGQEGEAEVIADGEAKLPQGGRDHHHLGAGADGGALLEAGPPGMSMSKRWIFR